MLKWEIRLAENSPGTYELRIPSPGAPGGSYRFVRQLPPDFSDFACGGGDANPKRIWRRPPGEKVDEGLLFCAGDLDTLKDIGSRLHDALFRHAVDGDTKDLNGEFMTLRGTAAATGADFRLDIDLTEAPQLARVPWEALYHSGEDLFLGIDTRTNIVRLLNQRGPLPAPIKPPIRMLVAVANPGGDIEAGTEVADIERRVSELLDDGCARYEVQTLPQATRTQFGNRVENWKPHIIHFIGHGGFDDDKGLIYLHKEHDPRERDPIDSATLRDFVRNDCPWLVVLNSCLSGAAAKVEPFGGAAQNLIRVNVPFVVAMQSPVSDQAAVRFSQRFYASLMQKETVAVAVSRGRNAIKGLGEESLRAELITPVLYMNGQADRLAIHDSPAKPARRVNLDRVLVLVSTITGIAGALFAYLQWQVSAPQPPSPSSPRIAAPAAYPDSAPSPRSESRAGTAAQQPTPAAGPRRDPDRFGTAYAANSGSLPSASAPTEAHPGTMREAEVSLPSPGFGEPPGQPLPGPPAASPHSVGSRSAAVHSIQEAGRTKPARPTRIDGEPSTTIRRELTGGGAQGGILGAATGVSSREDRMRGSGGPYYSRSLGGALSRQGQTLDAVTMARLDLAALKARNGAEIVLPAPPRFLSRGRHSAAAAPSPQSGSSSRRTRLIEAYLLGRGVDRESLRYERGGGFESSSYGYYRFSDRDKAGSDRLDFTLRYPPSFRGRPAVVLATFPAGSSTPLAADLAGLTGTLLSPAAAALAVELVGRTDSAEAAGDIDLGAQRAGHVARLFLESGVAGDRIRMSSAVPSAPGAAASDPALDRRVDGRLLLPGAERISFRARSSRISSGARPVLDRLADLLEGGSGLRLHLASGSEADADPKAGKRLSRVRRQLMRRGVDEDRVEIGSGAVGPVRGLPSEAQAPSVEVTVIAVPPQQFRQ